MAYYEDMNDVIFKGKLDNKIFVEQNILNNGELESYTPTFNINGSTKTSVLYYYKEGNDKFYSLGLLENLKSENTFIVEDDLSQILKFKTAKKRRELLFKIIEANETDIVY